MEDCFRAVEAKEADAVLACNYRMGEYEPMRLRYKFIALPTGNMMGLSFAVSVENPELYSILNKIAILLPSEDMEYALVTYMYSNQKATLRNFVEDNWHGVILFILTIFSVILFLLYKRLYAERRLNEQQKKMEEALRRELAQREKLQSVTRIAYTDPLTGVKSKHAFLEAEEQMDRRIAEKTVSKFAIVLFDLNNLKTINDTLGHEVGDQYIKEACRLACTRFKYSPIYRIGGDEFVAVLEGTDYDRRDDLLWVFEKQMDFNMKKGKITVAFGCACFDPEKDENTQSVRERADANMYQRKKRMKEAAKHLRARQAPQKERALSPIAVSAGDSALSALASVLPFR